MVCESITLSTRQQLLPLKQDHTVKSTWFNNKGTITKIYYCKRAFHCLIVKESGVPQSVIQSYVICSVNFGRSVSIPLPVWQLVEGFSVTVKNYHWPPPKSDISNYLRSATIIIFHLLAGFASNFPPKTLISPAMEPWLYSLWDIEISPVILQWVRW